MNYIDSATLHEAMNRLGRERTPFLWCASYELDKCFIIGNPSKQTEVLWQIGNLGNASSADTPVHDRTDRTMRITGAIERKTYSGMFGIIMEGLRRGDSFLANLTAATRVECGCSFRNLFLSSSAPFRLLIEDEFVCFSPEPFVRIKGRRISTFPMKGTADASCPDAEKRLLADYKELCEHHTIVDLMRNDLNSVSEEVRVDRFRYVEEIETSRGRILQTSSEISGMIPEEKTGLFGDIILPLLPAGSITGAPKPSTIGLIARAERTRRGWYTGVFGYFDGHIMQTAVMIRCLQKQADGSICFHSGGGITVNSSEEEEYAALMAKVYLTEDRNKYPGNGD